MKFFLFFTSIFSYALAIQFNCTFIISGSSYLDSRYTCVVQSVIYEDNENLTGVTGIHLQNKNNSDVAFLDVRDKTIVTFIPKDMENFFPNISAMRFSRCNISRVNADDLNAFDQLEWIAIESNPIERIPRDFFAKNPKIRVVYFYALKIKHVGTGLLDSLQDLFFANFGANTCISKTASNASEISALIEELLIKCPDIEEVTTTTEFISTTTLASSTEVPTCDFNEVVCNLQDQNKIMNQKSTI
jgi:hypothetical protein